MESSLLLKTVKSEAMSEISGIKKEIKKLGLDIKEVFKKLRPLLEDKEKAEEEAKKELKEMAEIKKRLKKKGIIKDE